MSRLLSVSGIHNHDKHVHNHPPPSCTSIDLDPQPLTHSGESVQHQHVNEPQSADEHQFANQPSLTDHVVQKVSETAIMVNGFKFTIRHKGDKDIKYRCSTRKPHCSASCTTDNSMTKLLSLSDAHNHEKHIVHIRPHIQPNIEVISTSPPSITVDGFKFSKHSSTSSGIYFQCQDKDCHVRCKTTATMDEVISTAGAHNHDLENATSNEG